MTTDTVSSEMSVYCVFIVRQSIVIIIIIIIIILVITFIIYNYVPETNYVYNVHSVVAVLYLQTVLHVMLFGP